MAENHTTALFVFSLERQDSTAAAKNFMTLYNGSVNRVMTLGAVFTSYMSSVASPSYALRGFRTTDVPSGGTLHAASEICPFDSQRFDPEMVIRSNNPTATPGAAFFNVAPGLIQGQNQSSDIQQVDAPFGFNPFTLYPGEAVAIRQAVGNPGHLWNLSVVWRELRR